ncbi:MAG: hypothetical protein KDD25_05070, partial [Bdellovibrionales bacterium]|nr:hypothetical protein [Bdellovibrionales bacterium]
MKQLGRVSILFLFLISLFIHLPANGNTPECALFLSRVKTSNDYVPEGLESALIEDGAVVPLIGTKAILDNALELVKSAKRIIRIEMYTFREPKLLEEISKKAKEGVRVEMVMADPRGRMGLSSILKRDQEIINELRASGVEVAVIPNSVLNRTTGYLKVEDHVKLLIVDDVNAYLGSSNLYYRANNFDVGVLIHGPPVNKLVRYFYRFHTPTIDSQAINENDSDPDIGVEFLVSRDLYNGIKPNLLEKIANAKRSITFAYWDASDRDVIEALEEKVRANPDFKLNVLLGPSNKLITVLGQRY